MKAMRATINLTPEADSLVAVKSVFETPTFDLGRPRVPIEHALRLAGGLEDEELLRQRPVRRLDTIDPETGKR